MKQFAGYIRVSTVEQLEDGTSIDIQKNKIKLECEKRGWKLHKFYDDSGISGKTIEKRHSLKQLLEDAENKKFDGVIFTDIDRLARNNRELLHITHIIREENKLDFVCISAPWIDSQSPFADVMLSIFGAFAEFERKQTRKRTVEGRFEKWSKLESFMGQAPYGYELDKKSRKMVEIPEKKDIYLQIVSLYLQGFSMSDIANTLTDKKVPTPSSHRWKKGKSTRWNVYIIRKILIDPCYKGECTYNKYFHIESKSEKQYSYRGKEEKPESLHITIKFPPFISEEKWDEIQKKREFNKKKPKKSHKKYENHFMAVNVIRCGECNSKMTKIKYTLKDGTPVFKYRCYWKHADTKKLITYNKERCILKTVDAELIDQEIFSYIVDAMVNPFKFAEKWLKDQNKDELISKQANLADLISVKEKELNKVFTFIKGLENEDAIKRYTQLSEKDHNELSQLQSELKAIDKELNLIDSKVDRLAEFKKSIKNFNGNSYGSIKVDKHRRNIKEYLLNLPFKEKQRVIESIIGTDGKCKIRHWRQSDLLDPEIEYDYKKDEIIYDKPPRVDMEFFIDLEIIEEIINSLNKDELLNKFDYAKNTFL